MGFSPAPRPRSDLVVRAACPPAATSSSHRLARRPPCYRSRSSSAARPTGPLNDASAPVSPGGPGRRGPAGELLPDGASEPVGDGTRKLANDRHGVSVRLGEARGRPGVRRGDEVEGAHQLRSLRALPTKAADGQLLDVVGLRGVDVEEERSSLCLGCSRCGNSPTGRAARDWGSPANRRCGSPPLGCGLPHPADMTAAMPYTSTLAESLADDLLERFLRYVRVDTQSARDRDGSPSTPRPARARAAARGRAARRSGSTTRRSTRTATCSPRCRRTVDGDAPAVGLLAHLDTSPDAPGDGRRADRAPRLRRRHDRAPARRHRARPGRHAGAGRSERGHDIVTSSGDTLLGRRRQGRDGRDHGGRRAPRRATRSCRARRSGRLHARRGGRPGRARGSTSSASAPPAPTRSTARSRASCRTRPSPAPRSR